ncbi:hypothetical protein EJ07DRAFT_154573 [Lizonia empirigonia]|nr:hypothetical protein EJ07DRAFT_154573 [Lizonia empirigonia]
MNSVTRILLACLALYIPLAFALGCASNAQLDCDAEILPANSWENQCWFIDEFDWTNPSTRRQSDCFCHEEGKAILQRWWDCFYTHVASCPWVEADTGLHMSFQIWFEETCYHRYKRRYYCNDDYKPTPPWDEIDNERMKRNYNLSQPFQYSFDDERTVRGVPWYGCDPENDLDRSGHGWPRLH